MSRINGCSSCVLLRCKYILYLLEFCVRISCDLCKIIQIINFLNSEQLFSCCLSEDNLSPLSDMLANEVSIMLVTLFRFAYNTTADIVFSFNNPLSKSADHHLLRDTGLTGGKSPCTLFHLHVLFI